MSKPFAIVTATTGVDRLSAGAAGRPVDALLANAGHRLGVPLLDQAGVLAEHHRRTAEPGSAEKANE